MGLLVPMYPYYSAKGTSGKREKKEGTYNNDNKNMLEAFFDFLRRPLVKEIGVKCRAIYPREESAETRKIDWKARTVYEAETEGRPELEALMNELDDRGTIVIPNRHHLTAHSVHAGKLIKRLCEGSLAPIALEHPALEEARQPLERHFRGAELLPDLEHRIRKFFNVLTSDAVRVRGVVENSRVRKPFEAEPRFER